LKKLRINTCAVKLVMIRVLKVIVSVVFLNI